jgi:hypothetical protein
MATANNKGFLKFNHIGEAGSWAGAAGLGRGFSAGLGQKKEGKKNWAKGTKQPFSRFFFWKAAKKNQKTGQKKLPRPTQIAEMPVKQKNYSF